MDDDNLCHSSLPLWAPISQPFPYPLVETLGDPADRKGLHTASVITTAGFSVRRLRHHKALDGLGEDT